MDPRLLLVIEAIRLLSYGLQHAPEVAGEIRDVMNALKGAGDDRPVSPEEWADMRARLDRASHALSVL